MCYSIRKGGPNSINTGLTQDTTVITRSNGKRERETTLRGARNYISGFEGS
jgi:hypothetical protein